MDGTPVGGGSRDGREASRTPSRPNHVKVARVEGRGVAGKSVKGFKTSEALMVMSPGAMEDPYGHKYSQHYIGEKDKGHEMSDDDNGGLGVVPIWWANERNAMMSGFEKMMKQVLGGEVASLKSQVQCLQNEVKDLNGRMSKLEDHRDVGRFEQEGDVGGGGSGGGRESCFPGGWILGLKMAGMTNPVEMGGRTDEGGRWL